MILRKKMIEKNKLTDNLTVVIRLLTDHVKWDELPDKERDFIVKTINEMENFYDRNQ